MPKFERLPLVIDAVQFWPDMTPWPHGVSSYPLEAKDGMPVYFVYNRLHDSAMALKPGDWVRQDDPNDYYPIDQETFTKTYRLIE